jgi:transcriptional regulator with XRE-family HTH domain
MMEYGDLFNYAVATELRAQRARVRITYDALVQETGLAKSTLVNYLEGRRPIPLSAFAEICRALRADQREVFTAAQQSIEQADRL